MKKTYIQPDTQFISVKTTSMIAASLRYGDAITNGETIEGDGRGNSDLWDDED